MGEGAPGELRYKGFLSYSHKDARAAARLHRQLEGYRLPKRLAGRSTALGTVPQRLWPIFRDREEMAASSDLSETVRAALSDSATLVVLCSPDAAASLWVNEEIRTYRALHPGRPVLAAILDGDPPHCFPKALRSRDPDGIWHEPLATDLRRRGDGARLGLLKLVAGITGVALDDLVQRDAARRIRRVTAVTVGALAAMLIMAALMVLAVDARREADRQRAEAEGLIEFMLTDLRERLKGVGRLDALTSVNRRAFRYYGARRDLSGLRDGSLERRARILHAIGEDELKRDRHSAAVAAFLEAHRTSDALLQRMPRDPHRIFLHAQSEFWLGNAHLQLRQWPEARGYFQRYQQAAERLIEIDPSSARYMMEMGHSAINIGDVELNGGGEPSAAQRLFERALQWFRAVERLRPGDDNVLQKQANSYAWIADTFDRRSLWAPALDARRRQLAIVTRLRSRNMSNWATLYDLTLAERAVGSELARLGERREALGYFRRAHEKARSLTDHDPANSDWLVLRAKLECEILYFGGPGRIRSESGALRRSLASAIDRLTSRGSSEASGLARCLQSV